MLWDVGHGEALIRIARFQVVGEGNGGCAKIKLKIKIRYTITFEKIMRSKRFKIIFVFLYILNMDKKKGANFAPFLISVLN